MYSWHAVSDEAYHTGWLGKAFVDRAGGCAAAVALRGTLDAFSHVCRHRAPQLATAAVSSRRRGRRAASADSVTDATAGECLGEASPAVAAARRRRSARARRTRCAIREECHALQTRGGERTWTRGRAATRRTLACHRPGPCVAQTQSHLASVATKRTVLSAPAWPGGPTHSRSAADSTAAASASDGAQSGF